MVLFEREMACDVEGGVRSHPPKGRGSPRETDLYSDQKVFRHLRTLLPGVRGKCATKKGHQQKKCSTNGSSSRWGKGSLLLHHPIQKTKVLVGRPNRRTGERPQELSTNSDALGEGSLKRGFLHQEVEDVRGASPRWRIPLSHRGREESWREGGFQGDLL